jgi:hypothetical protein
MGCRCQTRQTKANTSGQGTARLTRTKLPPHVRLNFREGQASKKLGIWKRKLISVIAHGAIVYRSLGSGYVIASPFWAEAQSKRIMLLDKEGKIVKDVEWR